MKYLFVLSVLATNAFAIDWTVKGWDRTQITTQKLKDLEAQGKAEVIPVRAQIPGETSKEYADYLYAVGGFSESMLPVDVFFGVGLRDPKRIIEAEGHVELNLLGGYSGGRQSAVGATAQAYFFPLRIFKGDSFLQDLYYSKGYTKYANYNRVADNTDFVSDEIDEVGFGGSMGRIGLARNKYVFKSNGIPQNEEFYLVKFALTLSPKNVHEASKKD